MLIASFGRAACARESRLPLARYKLVGSLIYRAINLSGQHALQPRYSTAARATAMAQEFDLVTIGAGSGGTRCSRFAAQYYNAKVACVELPFGFVSSGDVGGKRGAGRHSRSGWLRGGTRTTTHSIAKGIWQIFRP